MNTRYFSRMRLGHPLVRLLLVYLLVCSAALPWYLHRVGPDAVSYLTIAQKYRAGDFHNAVNGYWSPLLSWLIAPLLCLGVAPEVTAKCLQIAIGAGVLSIVWWLGKRLQLSEVVRVLTTLCLVPAVMMYALSDTTPDLLVAGLLLAYLGVVIGADYPRSPWQGAACGLLGALAYLAKAYAFPFFLSHFIAVSGYLFLRRRSSGEELRRLAAGTAAGLLVFALLAGGWAGLISRKYSRITIGTTGAYQFSLSNRGHPTEVGGLYPPANASAVSAWEDPSDLRGPTRNTATKPAVKPKAESTAEPAVKPTAKPTAKPKAKPVGNGWPFAHMLHRIYGNGIRYMGTLFRLSPVSPFILLGLLVSCWIVPRGAVRDRCAILLDTLLLYPSGYLMIFINERFFWIITFLLSVSAGLLATTLPFLRRNPWHTCWAVVAALSFTLWPAWILFRLWHHVLEETPAVAAQLRPVLPPGTRIASDREWGITNSIAFHLNARYYGLLRTDCSTEEQESQLREHRIQYLMLWGDPSQYPFLASGREVPIEPVSGLRRARLPRMFELPTSPDEPGPSRSGILESR